MIKFWKFLNAMWQTKKVLKRIIKRKTQTTTQEQQQANESTPYDNSKISWFSWRGKRRGKWSLIQKELMVLVIIMKLKSCDCDECHNKDDMYKQNQNELPCFLLFSVFQISHSPASAHCSDLRLLFLKREMPGNLMLKWLQHMKWQETGQGFLTPSFVGFEQETGECCLV